MVVERGHEEYPLALSELLLGVLEVADLHDDGEILDQEDSAKDRQEQFDMDQYGVDGNYSADGKRAGVAHEDLRRVGVVPQETDGGPDEGGHVDHKFGRVGYEHDVQVVGEGVVRRDVGNDAESPSDD